MQPEHSRRCVRSAAARKGSWAFAALKCKDSLPCNMRNPFQGPAQSGKFLEARVFCSTSGPADAGRASARAHGPLRDSLAKRSKNDHRSRKRRWSGPPGARLGTVRCRVGCWWQTQVLGQPASASQENCLSSSSMWTGAELFGLFMFLRRARALAQYVTDSSLRGAWRKPTWAGSHRAKHVGVGGPLSVTSGSKSGRKVQGTHYS